MIVLSAGCASLASLMRQDADPAPCLDTTRAPIEPDRRPRLVSMSDRDQPAVFSSSARQTR